MNILGISAYYHDSAAALLQKGQVIAAALEERFTRVKHDSRFPLQSIQYCLESAHMSIADVDLIAYYEEPVEKCARQLWAGFDRLNHHSVDFCKKISTCRIEQDIREKLGFDGKIEYFPHHHSHAALAFYGSGFDTAAVLVVDGVGEWASTSFGIAQNNEIHFYRHIEFPDSLGLFYSAMTSFLGFSVNDGEYKVMGLAPYGLPKYVKLIRSLLSNGSGFGCDPQYFQFNHEIPYTTALSELFGIQPRLPGAQILTVHKDIAASAQKVLEDILVEWAIELQSITGKKKLCFAGGVALNCSAVHQIQLNTDFNDIFVPPGAGDDGCAIGAAYLAQAKNLEYMNQPMTSAFLGPSFSNSSIKALLHTIQLPWSDPVEADVFQILAEALAEGATLGWFSGPMEFGARALGARSILADPRNQSMSDTLNKAIKQRESFRPFAPIVIESEAQRYFEIETSSPFMTEVFKVHDDVVLPGITHVNGTARVQTITKKCHPQIMKLMEAFYVLTGCPILINTSFNLKDEPIVCTPEDAIACFILSGLDILYLEGILLYKKNLPADYRDNVKAFYEFVEKSRSIHIHQQAYSLL